MNRLHSYPKVWNLGHAAIKDLFDGPVVIQEKIDGSQFTFGMLAGELLVRSKGKEIHLPTTDKLFKGACETAEALFNEGKLVEGESYRAEVMCRPKHNTLEYERVPNGNLILFDVDTGLEDRIANPERLAEVAGFLGLEVVPTLYVGVIEDLEGLKQHLETDSILGIVLVLWYLTYQSHIPFIPMYIPTCNTSPKTVILRKFHHITGFRATLFLRFRLANSHSGSPRVMHALG